MGGLLAGKGVGGVPRQTRQRGAYPTEDAMFRQVSTVGGRVVENWWKLMEIWRERSARGRRLWDSARRGVRGKMSLCGKRVSTAGRWLVKKIPQTPSGAGKNEQPFTGFHRFHNSLWKTPGAQKRVTGKRGGPAEKRGGGLSSP